MAKLSWMAEFKAAFLFVVPDASPNEHRAAIQVSKELVKEGVSAIELCAGFGQKGVAKVAEAVGYRAKVGVVRFDPHPALGSKSGDELFD